MISYEYMIRKLSQQKQRNKFKHKVKYGRELGEAFGYDKRGHMEEYNRLKNNPEQMTREFMNS